MVSEDRPAAAVAEPPGPPAPAARGRALAVLAVVIVAVNLRPAVTSVGPVLDEARADLGMSATAAGVLGSLPAICFALFGVLASRLARWRGPEAVIAAGAAVTAAGLAARPFAGAAAPFLALSAAGFAGIAVVNVLLPAVVKRRFPGRVGAVTGLYTMALNLGASTAAAVTVPLSGAFGGDWRAGVGAWAVLAALAVPPWLALARTRARAAAGPVTAEPVGPLARQPVAWALAVYFGLQATSAYVMIGWLPQIFRDAGLSASTAGLLFAVTSLLGVPLSFGLAALAGRRASQGGIAAALGLAGLAGYAGLWAAPATLPWLWAVLLGIANGAFPLALTMIGLRGRDAPAVARLSAFAQSVGYLLSVPGPILVGALYQHTGGWKAPLEFITLVVAAQIVAGLVAGRDRQVG